MKKLFSCNYYLIIKKKFENKKRLLMMYILYMFNKSYKKIGIA